MKIVKVTEEPAAAIPADADVIIDYRDEASALSYSDFEGFLVINSVINTLSDTAGPNIIRFNGWPGFAEKEVWECAGEETEKTHQIAAALGKKFLFVPDQAGFITPRVLAMIINEAFFASGEAVATESDIDLAMKLGTNYPFGPFEWCDRIGREKIAGLLERLSEENHRYLPAPGLSTTVAEVL